MRARPAARLGPESAARARSVRLEAVVGDDVGTRLGTRVTPSTSYGSMGDMTDRPIETLDRARNTWNDPTRIAAHRALSPKERLRLTIEASRAALRFAHGARRRGS